MMTPLLDPPLRSRGIAMITRHFSWVESERSQTAIARGLDNTLPILLEPAVLYTALQMERVRTVLDDILDITSWYRSPAVNRAVGSTDRSAHLLAGAVDFVPRTIPLDEAYADLSASSLPFDQLIIETDRRGARWIHAGWLRPPRGERMIGVWDAIRRTMILTRRTAPG